MRLFGRPEKSGLKKYAIMIRGENYLIQMDGADKILGFFTTRFVQATSPQQAFDEAVVLIRMELSGVVKNRLDDTPMMYFEKTTELESFKGHRVPGKGFTWFLGNSEKDELDGNGTLK